MPDFFDIALGRTQGAYLSSTEIFSIGNKGDYVILLHGLLIPSFCMRKIQVALERRGYNVINFSYPSRKYSIETLSSKFLAGCIRSKCISKKRKIHFVTHSLGGVIVRKYLHEYPIINMGKVVMFSPPNHGSEIADFFKNNFLYKFIYGHAGQQLGASKKSYVNSLPNKVQFDLGVIAGNSKRSFIASLIIKRKNDGVVSINSTKITGMKDHIVFDTSHTCLLYNNQAIAQMLFFLDNGSFNGS